MRLPPNEDPDKRKRAANIWSNQVNLPSRRRPKSLDDLLLHAEACAGEALRKTGRLIPTCFMLTPKGVIPVLAGSFADDRDKDRFVTAVRLVGAAEAAFAAVVMLDSWFVCAQPGKSLDPGIAPSESLDRREGILFVGESREAQTQKILPIIRTDAGGFFGFSEPQPLVCTMQNRFQQLLCPKPPDAKQRELARALLRTFGTFTGGSDRR